MKKLVTKFVIWKLAVLIALGSSLSALAMEPQKRILQENVIVNEINEEKLNWTNTECPSYKVMEDNPYKPRTSNIYDARNQKHTLEENGFEFVDFGSVELNNVLKKFLNPSNDANELRSAYAMLLKDAVEKWWIAKHPEDNGNIEWLPLYEGSGTLRDTSKTQDKTKSAFLFTHVDYYSHDDAIAYFKGQENMQPEAKVDEKIYDKNNYEIVHMANIWAPLDKTCKGFPLAVIDTKNLKEVNLPQILAVPPEYAIPFGAQPFFSRYLNANPEEIVYYSLSDWKRGEMVIFTTNRTPHTAYADGSNAVRHSIEVRGVILRRR